MQGFVAELVMGFRLVVRHPAPRVAGLLGASVAGCALVLPAGRDPAVSCRALLLVVGCAAAVCASRPFAAGPVLASVYQVAGNAWTAVAGRLTATVLVVGLGAATPAAVLCRAMAREDLVRAYVATIMYALVLVPVVSALTQRLGTAAGAAAGVALCVAGIAEPSQIVAFLGLARPGPDGLVALWVILPLPWHAAAWFAAPGITRLAVLAGWLAGGVLAAGHVPRAVAVRR